MLHALNKYNERIQDSANIIPEKEPVFLLRAQDRNAAMVVRYWAMCMAEKNPEMAKLAITHADKMEKWSVKKDPDV